MGHRQLKYCRLLTLFQKGQQDDLSHAAHDTGDREAGSEPAESHFYFIPAETPETAVSRIIELAKTRIRPFFLATARVGSD